MQLDYTKSYLLHPSKNIKYSMAGFEPNLPLTVEIPSCTGNNFVYIGYPYPFETNIEEFFSTIINKIVIIKDQDTFFIPNTGGELTTLKTGKGYQIQVSEDLTFTYPNYCVENVFSGDCYGSRYCTNSGQLVSTGAGACSCSGGVWTYKKNEGYSCVYSPQVNEGSVRLN